MGIFQHKSHATPLPEDELSQGMQEFFDGYFHELNERGQAYFEQHIHEKSAKFQKDLDLTVAKMSVELKSYLAERVDEQLAVHAGALKSAQDSAMAVISENVEQLQKRQQELSMALEDQFSQSTNAIKAAQQAAIDAMNRSVDALAEEQRILTATIQKSTARQDAQLMQAFEENTKRVAKMKKDQDIALELLSKNVSALEQQQELITNSLQKNIDKQQKAMVEGFEQNMVTIIERYLLGALGDSYDITAQLPAIIKQMEQHKTAMTEDMTL